MCCASLHLLIGVLLVLAVENEATTENSRIEITTVVPINITNATLGDFMDNFTLASLPPNSTVTVSNVTDVNASDGESDSPTSPPPTSEHEQTNNVTTEDPQKNSPQPSTNNRMPITRSKATTTRAPEHVKNHGATYIIIVIIAVLCLTGVVVYFCLQKNTRRYSVDFHPKQEDAQIPLSTVDAEVFDTTSEKDLQTFTPVEAGMAIKDPDPVKGAEKPEGEKDMRQEADFCQTLSETADVKPENQQNLSSAQATKIPQDKTDQLFVVDLTDGETAISTKTSMESLDDVLNENNSNNTSAKGSGNGNTFTEISLDGAL